MADLGSRSRGQLILVAAFALAVTFVALALVVNSAIFTENLASRGETGGSGDALTLRHDVERGVGQSIASANVYNTTDQSALQQGVDRGIGDVNTAYSKQSAADTAIVNVSRKSGSTTYGSRVVQNESGGRVFGPDNDALLSNEWTVIYGVERVTPASEPGNGTRAFRMNVSEAPTAATPFTVRAEEYGGSAEWRMELYGDLDDTVSDNEVTVTITKPSGSESCTVAVEEEYTIVDVTSGTVAGEPCDALRKGSFDGRFSNGVGQKYNITYANGDQIKGNYSLVTANNSAANMDAPNLNDSYDADDPRASPYVTEAVYDVTVRYVYQSPKLEYETDVRVAPGEPR